MMANDEYTYNRLIQEYNLMMFGQQHAPENRQITESTLCLAFVRQGMTTTVPEYRNINRDEIECLEYMELMAEIDPGCLLDIDEQSEAPKDFVHRVAHTYRGMPSVREQI